MTQACSAPGNQAGETNAPAPQVGIEAVELRDLISNSKRPYVLINFFATWCKPCRAELPDLIELENDPKSDIQVLLVSIDSEEDAKSKL
ncbi:MAG TPA: TlpA family protein disulfide reductase, partial [Bacteroidia bacterium]|nr:TlpA family protein disulfide reductase [Bacteroidia bacterium]